MAVDDHILQVSGTSETPDANGTYNLVRIDLYGLASSDYVWKHSVNDYYIFHDSFYWRLSTSFCRYDRTRDPADCLGTGCTTGQLIAQKAYTNGTLPTGTYVGVDGHSGATVTF